MTVHHIRDVLGQSWSPFTRVPASPLKQQVKLQHPCFSTGQTRFADEPFLFVLMTNELVVCVDVFVASGALTFPTVV